MVKLLLELCLAQISRPCWSEIDISDYWLNCGLRCIPFKFYQKLATQEYYHCTCRRRLFKVTFLERNNRTWCVTPRAMNCFHCWFVLFIKIKVEKLYKHRNNLVYFASLLIDFFSFINKYKYIYIRSDFANIKYLHPESFNFYLSTNDPCLCYCPESGRI